MARGKLEAKKVDGEKWSFKGFINYEFSEPDIGLMKAYFDERTFDHAETLMGWADAGFKVSMS